MIVLGAHFEIADIPDDMKDEAEKWRNHLLKKLPVMMKIY